MVTSEELRRRDAEHIIRAWASVAEPTVVVQAKGAILKDPEGREYVDCSSGLFAVNVGHSHPEVIQAIKDQAEKVVQVSILQTTQPVIELAEQITALAPGDLKKAFFTVGGTESIEAAIKMARGYTGKCEIIVLKNAFHGLGGAALAATGASSYKKGFGPLAPGFVRAPHAYCYRCPFNLTYPGCDLRCADEIDHILTDTAISSVSEGDVGAVLVEPAQGRGGIVPPDEWLVRVREICDRRGVSLVLDEIQTAFGRTGKMFACEHRGVVPDIMVLSKNVGGGIPSGMVLTSARIADSYKTGTTSTHAGNALAAAAGLAALRVLLRDRLAENARKMGERFREGFEDMRSSQYLGQARFKGLLGGIELVVDRKTKEPMTRDRINRIKEEAWKRGVVTSASGPLGNVFRIQPPLCITGDQVDRVVNAFDEAIHKVME